MESPLTYPNPQSPSKDVQNTSKDSATQDSITTNEITSSTNKVHDPGQILTDSDNQTYFEIVHYQRENLTRSRTLSHKKEVINIPSETSQTINDKIEYMLPDLLRMKAHSEPQKHNNEFPSNEFDQKKMPKLSLSGNHSPVEVSFDQFSSIGNLVSKSSQDSGEMKPQDLQPQEKVKDLFYHVNLIIICRKEIYSQK